MSLDQEEEEGRCLGIARLNRPTSLSLSLFETTNGSKTLLILIMAKIRPISGRGTDRVRGYGVYGTD